MLVLSMAPSEQEAMLALQSGARGYAHALLAPNLLQQAALVTANQGVWVPAELLNRVLGATYKGLGGAERVSQELLSELTERERAVAMAVAEGVSNKEVARRLNITERTVKAHLGAVFRKTGVRDRMQLLVKLAVQDERIV
ncbi:LuxR C-terminal-related transcriptional regulator [Halomonas sp. E14]|uniref:LuxR C-terminal-related transcriptional regulator n=1 Tax=Halomonas sp. E14 TaxID=3397245 RepID=UPI00403EAB38